MKPLSTVLTTVGLILCAVSLNAQNNFVYTNNDIAGSNSVSGFSVDANGVLTEVLNSPFATGGGGIGGGGFAINRIVVSGGKYLYASDSGTSDIAAFVIDPTLGGLTPVPGSPFPTGTGASFFDISLAASPDGKFLFAGLSSNNTVVSFGIGGDGSLSQIAATANLTAPPDGMKVTPDGQHLAVALPAYLGFGAIAMFSIAADGTLTMVNNLPFIGTGNVAGIDVNCASNQLFGGVMTQNGGLVDAYTIDASGALSRISGSPFPAAGKNSNVVLLNPNDQFLFVANQFSQSVSSLAVAGNGTLTLVGGSPFAIGVQATNPSGMATDQGGAFLYVASNPNLIQVFGVAADGSLAPAAGSPFSTNQSGGLLSLAAFPAKTCGGSGGGTAPPPVISGMPAASCTLWPPQHQMVEVATVTAASTAGLASFDVTGTSNEPSDPDGPDIVITGSGLDPRVVSLRAERLGSGTGRVYTLTATATDVAGNTTTSTATCVVPHDQGN